MFASVAKGACWVFLTVRAWSASHSCGEWILWTSRVTAIWGLQKVKFWWKTLPELLQINGEKVLWVPQTYPSSSLLIWSQKPMIYSQSSCLFVGWVALSVRQNACHTCIYYTVLSDWHNAVILIITDMHLLLNDTNSAQVVFQINSKALLLSPSPWLGLR